MKKLLCIALERSFGTQARQKSPLFGTAIVLTALVLTVPVAAQNDVHVIGITGCTTAPGCRTSSSAFSTLGINVTVPIQGFCADHIIDFNARAVVNSLDNGNCQFQVTKTVGSVTTVLAESEIGGGRYPAFMRLPVAIHAENTSVCNTSVTYGVRWRSQVGGICTVLSTVSGTASSGALLTDLWIRR